MEIDGKQYKVVYKHFRVHPLHAPQLRKKGAPNDNDLSRYVRGDGRAKEFEPFSRGGKTLCEIVDESGPVPVIFVGVSVCSMSDQFRYDVGRVKAFGRAISHLQKHLKGETK